MPKIGTEARDPGYIRPQGRMPHALETVHVFNFSINTSVGRVSFEEQKISTVPSASEETDSDHWEPSDHTAGDRYHSTQTITS